MRLIQNISDAVFKLEKLLVIILIPLMLIAMVLDIIFRYFVNSPLIWGQELALYTFVWSSFIGASMSIKLKEAVAVTIFVDRVNVWLRNASIILGLCISTIFSLTMLYFSIKWITDPNILLQKSITTQTPMIIMYVCIPISLLFISLHFIHLFTEALRQSREKKVIE